ANSALGLARAHGLDCQSDRVMEGVQQDLFLLGAEIASGRNAQKKLGMPLVSQADIERLETAIDQAEQDLKPLESFILPGGSPAAAALHLARTVIRRGERNLVTLSNLEEVRKEVLEYVNRLSDLFFVYARRANCMSNNDDILWTPPKG
ncbi:MAG: ATP:cob(I)alamin adenosyltransferase, partial [Sorangium cellulosum]